MNNNENIFIKKDVSFEGIGKLTIKYEKFSERIEQKLLKKLAEIGGTIEGDLKTALIKNGLLNEKGEAIGLAPKLVKIEHGSDYIDESKIQNAKTVVLKGGHLDHVINANYVSVYSGTNAGINAKKHVGLYGVVQKGKVNTDSLLARNSVIEGNTVVRKSATLTKGSSNKGSLNIHQTLHVFDSTVNNAVVVHDVYAKGNSTLNKVNAGYSIFAEGNTVLNDVTTGHNVQIYENAKANGVNAGGNFHAYDGTKATDVMATGEAHVNQNKDGIIKGLDAGFLYVEGFGKLIGHIAGDVQKIGDNVQITPATTFNNVGHQTVESLRKSIVPVGTRQLSSSLTI